VGSVVAASVVAGSVVAGEVVAAPVVVDASVEALDSAELDDSSVGCDEHAATMIAPPMIACRVHRTDRGMLDISRV
jgi:hypothetical protein